MTILKIPNIDQFEAIFKQELHQEKKYLPIYQKLVVLLDDINPSLSWIDQHIHFKQKMSVDIHLQIHKNYLKHIEALNQKLTDYNQNHKTKIDDFQKDKIHKLHEINLEQKEIVNKFENDKERLKKELAEKIKKYDQQLKRELSQFENEKLSARKVYQSVSKDIEEEKNTTVLHLEKRYASIINEVNLNLEQFKIDQQKELDVFEQENQETKAENDQTYLTIKNNYHLLTTQFNKAINKLKNYHEKAKTNLENHHQQLIDPIHQTLDELNQDYQKTIDQAQSTYQESLRILDDKFNMQKEKYEEKKAKIIHVSNEQITLLNSKLSAYRESIAKEKLDESRSYRDLIKKAETEREKDKINHTLTNVLKALDNDLNKQILRTQKDIVVKQKELQQNLYNHDLRHLKEMNDWRLKRNLLNYEHKQDIAKIDLNFNHNLNVSKKHLNLLNDTYDYQRHVLQVTHRKDLLPLETQLQVQSQVQERELNLLNNDQHLATYLWKYEIAKINHKYHEKKELELFREQKARLDYETETQVISITSQLELEKIRSKRDLTQNEQDIRADIAKALYEKNISMLNKNYMFDLEEIHYQEQINDIEKRFLVEDIKLDQQIKHQDEEHDLLKAKSEHQSELSHEKTTRLLKIYLNELYDQQTYSEQLFYGLRLFYKKHQSIKHIIKELYLLPSHPEIFKHMLEHLLKLEESFKEAITNLITYFKDMNFSFYQKKIEDQTEYKYMLKYDDSMKIYEQDIEKINVQKNEVSKEIEALEQQFFIYQQDIDKHTQFMNQLDKINDGIQAGLIKTNAKHKDIKDNKQLILNHEKEIKKIKHELQLIEKNIDKKHLKLMPLDKQIERVHQKMQYEQETLKKHQQKESNHYHLKQTINQSIYEQILKDYLSFINAHETFINVLNDQVYVTDSVLNFEEKKLNKSQHIFEQKLITNQQKLLSHILDFYMDSQAKQDAIESKFNRSQEHWLNELKSSYQTIHKQLQSLSSKHIKDKQDALKDLQNQYATTKKNKQNEYDKAFESTSSQIKALEQKLEDHLSFMNQELKLINDNQKQIANQSFQEYQKQLGNIESSHQKQMAKYAQTLEQEQRTYQNFLESTENKNQTLLSRFEQNRIKTIDTHKQKLEHFNIDIDKARMNQEKRQKNYDMQVKQMGENRTAELKNMKDHIKKYKIKAESVQQKVLRHEQRSLRKNFRFKLKSLHLK